MDELEPCFVRFAGYCIDVACIDCNASLLRQRSEIRKAQARCGPDRRAPEQVDAGVRTVRCSHVLRTGKLQSEGKRLVRRYPGLNEYRLHEEDGQIDGKEQHRGGPRLPAGLEQESGANERGNDEYTLFRSAEREQPGHSQGPCAGPQKVRGVDRVRLPRHRGIGSGDDQSETEERNAEDDVVEAYVKYLDPVPGKPHRIERNGVGQEIGCGDAYGEHQCIPRYLTDALQAWKNREHGPAGADAQHGDADDHEGEVIPEGNGKGPHERYFVGEAPELNN